MLRASKAARVLPAPEPPTKAMKQYSLGLLDPSSYRFTFVRYASTTSAFTLGRSTHLHCDFGGKTNEGTEYCLSARNSPAALSTKAIASGVILPAKSVV